ncbi:site-specific DNA-methyltransferase [Amylibacter marinus]|uniref:site-specific DNA-methyltransferase (adenine-specific) n=1 Tax=Amylibacter marinus TaxID=1475483 RepID=A0ABQ5VRR4_9RHOB|nr:site-specific DNA-methyltransferase [Amylibacter marinus]GLQ33861.1 site-specific DNA-methyltransferase [Amylibacter marinus]
MKNITTKDGQSADLIGENIEHMKQLFPDAFSENGVDFDVLRQLLGDASVLDEGEEKYGLNWHGKKKARQIALTPSMGTLLPCVDESVDWDTTQNLFIEGDNLEVLKLLQKSYANKVKLIYIDPPYNTGNEFVYPDNYQDNLDTYLKYTGQKGEQGLKLTSNTETGGRKHTNWLNMMYPRLKLAKNLLSSDGLIFVSIDDNEQEKLKEICSEIFGSENFVSCLVWEKKKKGTFLSNSITSVKEYVLVYCKNAHEFNGLIGEINSSEETYPCINASNKRSQIIVPSGILSKYREKNFRLEKGSVISASTMDLILHSDLVVRDGVLAEELIIEGNWRYKQEAMKEFAENGELYLTQDLYLRRIVKDPRRKTLKDLLPRVGDDSDASFKEINVSNLFADGWGSNEDGEEELRTLLGQKGLLEFPKPRKLIEKLIASVRDDEMIVLDFFAGSGVTAHAVMDLNSRENSTISSIVVQLPEKTDEGSAAFDAGYLTISDLAKERIRRAANKIQDENPDYKGDLGFKVFKLAESNIRAWNPDRTDLEETLLSHQEHLLEGRTEQDLLYELLLKRGVDLAVPIETREVAGKTIYSIGAGVLFACLDPSLSTDEIELVAEGILAWQKELDPEADTHVFFRDSAFNNDNVAKTNMVAILEQNGITHVRSL